MRQKQQARADQKERKQSKDGPRTTPLAVGTQRRLRRGRAPRVRAYFRNERLSCGRPADGRPRG